MLKMEKQSFGWIQTLVQEIPYSPTVDMEKILQLEYITIPYI